MNPLDLRWLEICGALGAGLSSYWGMLGIGFWGTRAVSLLAGIQPAVCLQMELGRPRHYADGKRALSANTHRFCVR